jgi:hypothetical protein
MFSIDYIKLAISTILAVVSLYLIYRERKKLKEKFSEVF